MYPLRAMWQERMERVNADDYQWVPGAALDSLRELMEDLVAEVAKFDEALASAAEEGSSEPEKEEGQTEAEAGAAAGAAAGL
jgi:hypothetical protein